MRETDRLRQTAGVIFQNLTASIGLDPSLYVCKAEWLKDNPDCLHIVQRYDGLGLQSLILKYVARPIDIDGFDKILEGHRLAQTVLDGHKTASVPRILAEDRDAQAYIMTFLEGETFLELCRNADDHIPFLKAAGEWLSAFHAGTFQQERPYQAKFMLGHMDKLVEQIERGEREIKGQKRFIQLARKLGDFSHDADGYVGKIAAKHGDLNAHNLIIGNGTIAAFDFFAQSYSPVAHDIARILLSYVQTVGDIDAIPRGHIIPPEAKDAFFEGYSFVNQQDPTIDFLMRTQVLTDWKRMRAKPSLNAIIRFERLRSIARRAFA